MATRKPKPLTLKQIETLTDSILDYSGHEEEVTVPLLLLMDDLAHNLSDNSQIESLVNMVKGRCYASTVDSDKQENAYIERARERWAKVLEVMKD